MAITDTGPVTSTTGTSALHWAAFGRHGDLADIRRELSLVLLDSDLPATEVSNLLLATDEACSYVARHGAPGTVTVGISVDDVACVITVVGDGHHHADRGPAAHPASPSAARSEPSSFELMAALTDDVKVDVGPTARPRVVLTKRLS